MNIHVISINEIFGMNKSSFVCVCRDALTKASLSQPVLKNLCLYVAQDCTGEHSGPAV